MKPAEDQELYAIAAFFLRGRPDGGWGSVLRGLPTHACWAAGQRLFQLRPIPERDARPLERRKQLAKILHIHCLEVCSFDEACLAELARKGPARAALIAG